VSIADICTAINTVAILITGDAAKQIAKKHQISPVRTAGFLDIFSCVFQGILPYSAQILLAGALAGISPLEIVANVHYCFILGIIALGSVVFQFIKG
jgi:Na+/H+ antiporter NhaC